MDSSSRPVEDVPPPIPEPQPGSTEYAGQSIDEGKGRIFPCERCGADLTFNIGQQDLKCPYCGFEKRIQLDENAVICEQDFHETLARQMERRTERIPEGAEQNYNNVRCASCGANVVFTGTLTSSFCPYCGSPIQRDEVHTLELRIPVDGVMPFLIEETRARSNLAAWVRSRWFAPNTFLKHGVDGNFHGVYLPYWTFDSLTFTVYAGQRGEYYYVTVGTGKNRRTERRTRWYPASGRFQRFFDDVLVVATDQLNGKMLLALEPWPLQKCIPFTQQVLAGYFARTYDVELDAGFERGKRRIDSALLREVKQRIGGDTQRVSSVDTRYDGITFKHLLLPVWLLAYQYKEKPYQVFVNAATGEVQGERPYSWVKITLTVVSILATVGTVVFLMNR